MFRGKVTAVDAKGCYVLVAALDAVSPQGPLAWTGVTPKVGDPVLLADTGDGASPDLVVVGVLNSAVDYEGRWIDWTPTLTNITRGTGYSQRNRYTRSGKSLTFDFALHFGTGGSVSAEPSITLPVAPVSTNEKFFTALLRTTSTYSQGVGYQGAGTTMTFFALGTAGALLGDIASVTGLAGSWASTGRIQVTGTYEIA